MGISSDALAGVDVSVNGPEVLTTAFITPAWLRVRGTCEDQVLLFEKVFPSGMKPNKSNFEKAKKAGMKMEWFEKYLPIRQERN